MVLENILVTLKTMRDMEKVPIRGITARSRTEVSGVMVRKMELGTCATTLIISKGKGSGPVIK